MTILLKLEKPNGNEREAKPVLGYAYRLEVQQ